MAINYGLLDTTIPAQLGAIPGNSLAKFMQTKQQIEEQGLAREEAATRNALARMQLTRGSRELAEEDAYKNALAGVQGGDYAAAMPDLLKASPTRALALKKSLAEEQRGGMETALKKFEITDRIASQFAANPTRQMGVWTLSQLSAMGWPPAVIQEMSAKLNSAKDEELPAKAEAFLRMTQEAAKAHVASLYPKQGQPSPLGNLMAERDAALRAGDTARAAKYDQAIALETTRKEPTPYFQFIPTSSGIVRGDARSGAITPVWVGGAPVPGPSAPAQAPAAAPPPAAPAAAPGPLLPPSADPDLQRRLAAAKASGSAEGEATAKAQTDLPRATAQADELLQLTDELLKHPGLKQAVGASSILGVQKIPGTNARDFMIRLDQVRGKQFLEAFQSLKGAGAVTETEGKKATEAIARMDTSGTEEEFVRAVRDFQDVIRAGVERSKARAGASAPSAPTSGRVRLVGTPEEARALPPGTVFKTPDGREFVR